MPKNYRLKKKRGMRRRKVYRRKQRTTTVNRGLKPFASRYITKAKYSEAFTLSLSNGFTQIMNLNSLFDPNRTGIGHQPYGYDQLAQLYNRYRVIACSYVINGLGSSGDPIRLAAIPSNEPIASPFTISELCENPRCKWIVQYQGGATQYLKGKVYIPSLFGRTKMQYMTDDRYQADVGSSPAELALLTISTSSLTDTAVNTQIVVTMEYTCEWFDPKPLDQS